MKLKLRSTILGLMGGLTIASVPIISVVVSENNKNYSKKIVSAKSIKQNINEINNLSKKLNFDNQRTIENKRKNLVNNLIFSNDVSIKTQNLDKNLWSKKRNNFLFITNI